MEDLNEVEDRELQATKLYRAPAVEDLGSIRIRTGNLAIGQLVDPASCSVDLCEVPPCESGLRGTICLGDHFDIF